MDRLGNIEAFVAAADTNSFTRAAERLRLSPSALGRRIAQLEDELGVRLFHRTTRQVRLTDEGRVFHQRSRSALAELEQAQAALSSLREEPAGRLRVEAPTILGRGVVLRALPHFVATHPKVEIELSLRDQPSDPVAMGLDVALRMGALGDSGLIAKRLGSTRMCICASPAYLARAGTPRTVDDLARHERLAFAPHGRPIPWRLRDGARALDVEPSRRIVVDDAQALIDLAVAGAGLAWVCDFMIARGQEEGQLVEVLEHSASEGDPIHALSHPTRHVLPKVRAFTSFVAEALERAAPEPARPRPNGGRPRGARRP